MIKYRCEEIGATDRLILRRPLKVGNTSFLIARNERWKQSRDPRGSSLMRLAPFRPIPGHPPIKCASQVE